MTDTWQRGDWMQTHSGRRFYPLDPRPDDVDIDDIAHALAHLCRYAGHVDRFYSVAEHCVLLSHAVPVELALDALMHDAAEAYVVDVPRPLKRHLPGYADIEDRVLDKIWTAIGRDHPHPYRIPAEVKAADTRILLDERATLMANTVHEWDVDQLEPLGVTVAGWPPHLAKAAWLRRFRQLTETAG